MKDIKEIELLSPAGTAEIGREAILHGADAVYIGARAFGAREAAGNTTDDIAGLISFAHLYGAKVYVTLNTLLLDSELSAAERLAHELYEIGADALIVQDMGLLRLSLPPIALHASTQMDIRTPEKARFLEDMGFQQLVLARELDLEEIAAIRAVTSVPLEVFVHGALCVSYSGQCYASQYCFGRSANRGRCAQFCRLAFRLLDRDGRALCPESHLLSLRDMNRSKSLGELLQAGATSFKIEGRLKGLSYVKNVTASYRQATDRLIRESGGTYRRSSRGEVRLDFSPDPEKSFHRGFTDYYLHGRTEDCSRPGSPKSTGEAVGRVKEVRNGSVVVAGVTAFHNGDGLCYFDATGTLHGFRVNRAENNRLYPFEKTDIDKGTRLYRNFDHEFETRLSHPTAERTLSVTFSLKEGADGLILTLREERGIAVSLTLPRPEDEARTPQEENIRRQLGRLGGTPFHLNGCEIDLEKDYFLPSSLLARCRRELAERLQARLVSENRTQDRPRIEKDVPWTGGEELSFLANVGNAAARSFWTDHGVRHIEPAMETEEKKSPRIMFCKHCLRFALGCCPTRQGGPMPGPEPWTLALPGGQRFPLHFDCKNCQMIVYAPQ